MSIIEFIVTGLLWIMAAMTILSVIAGILLGIWMADKERIEKEREQEAEAQKIGSAHSPAHRRRRRIASGYQAQMP